MERLQHIGGSVGQRCVSRVVAVSRVSGVFQKIAKGVTRHYQHNVTIIFVIRNF
jgi:hypothetical protein